MTEPSSPQGERDTGGLARSAADSGATAVEALQARL
ncbi:MAG: hypothetical protein QOE01_1857, partial [Actinomycetota bacterium]|nr:hypothetical protein [Actinomycetota bacterium]